MGHRAMADDIAVIEMGDGGARVLPGLPHLRLWRDALDHFGIAPDGLVRALSSKEKYLLPPGDACPRGPRKLAAVVILSWRRDGAPSIERLYGPHAVGALHAIVHTRRPARALGRDGEIFLTLTRLIAAGVAVWRLRMPDDRAGLAPAAAKVLGVLEG